MSTRPGGRGGNGHPNSSSGACLLSPWIRDAACEVLDGGHDRADDSGPGPGRGDGRTTATDTDPSNLKGHRRTVRRGGRGEMSWSRRPKIVQVLSSSSFLHPSAASSPSDSNSNGTSVVGRCRSCPPYLVVHDGRTASTVFFSHTVRSDLFRSSGTPGTEGGAAAADNDDVDMSTTAQMHRARMDLARKRGTVIRLSTWYVSTVAHSTGRHFKHLTTMAAGGHRGSSSSYGVRGGVVGGPLCLFVEGGVDLLGCGGGAIATDVELVDLNDDVHVRALLQAPRIIGCRFDADSTANGHGNDANGIISTGTRTTATATAMTKMDHWELIRRVGAARRHHYHLDRVRGGDDEEGEDADDDPPPLLAAPPPDASGAVVSTDALALFRVGVGVSEVGLEGVVGVLPPQPSGGDAGDGGVDGAGAGADGGGGRKSVEGDDGVGPSGFVSELEAVDADARSSPRSSTANSSSDDGSTDNDDTEDDDGEGGGDGDEDGGIPGIDQVLAASSSDDGADEEVDGNDDGGGDGNGEAKLETQEGGEMSAEVGDDGRATDDPAARTVAEKSARKDDADDDSDATCLDDYPGPRPGDDCRSQVESATASNALSPAHPSPSRGGTRECGRGGRGGGAGPTTLGRGGGVGPSSLVSELEAADGGTGADDDDDDDGASSGSLPPDDDDNKNSGDSPPGGEENNNDDRDTDDGSIKKEDDEDGDEENEDAGDDSRGGASDEDTDDDEDGKDDDYKPNEDDEDDEDLDVDEEIDKEDETLDDARVGGGSDEDDSDDDRDEVLEEFVATTDLSTVKFTKLWLLMRDRLHWRAAAGRFHAPYRKWWPDGAREAVGDAISSARMRCIKSPSRMIHASSSSASAVVTAFDSADAVMRFLNSGRPRRRQRRQKRRNRGSKKQTPSSDNSSCEDVDGEDEDLSPGQTLARFLRENLLRAYYAEYGADIPPGGVNDDEKDDNEDGNGDDSKPNDDDEQEDDDKKDETLVSSSAHSGSDEESDEEGRDELLEEFVATTDLSSFNFSDLWIFMTDQLRWRAQTGKFCVPGRARWPEGAREAVNDAIANARMRCIGSPSAKILAPSSSASAVVTSFTSPDAVIWFLNSGRPPRRQRRQKRRRRGSKKNTSSSDGSSGDYVDEEDEDLSPSQTLARFLRDDLLRTYYAEHMADRTDRPEASATNTNATIGRSGGRNDTSSAGRKSAVGTRCDSGLMNGGGTVEVSTTHSTKTQVATNRRTSFGKNIRTRRRRKNMYTPPSDMEAENRNATSPSQLPPPSRRYQEDGRRPITLGPLDVAEARSSPDGMKGPPAAMALPGDTLRRAVAANRNKKRKRPPDEQNGKYFNLGAWMSKNLRKFDT